MSTADSAPAGLTPLTLTTDTTTDTITDASANTNASDIPPPISPVARTGSFPHRTSPAVAPAQAFISTATPAINTQPVELDGEALVEGKGKGHKVGKEGQDGSKMFSPDLGDQVMEELSGIRGEGTREREKRAALLSSRSRDPAVLVDIPRDPNADEVAAANTIAGQVTPSLGQEQVAEPVERVLESLSLQAGKDGEVEA